MKSDGRIDNLIEKFDKMNINTNYTQRDLLKYLISKVDDLEDKMDDIVNNHINTLTRDVASIKTTISNFKWFFGGGAMIAIIIAIISVCLAIFG